MIRIHYKNSHKLSPSSPPRPEVESMGSPTTPTLTGLASCVTRKLEITTSSPTITEFYTRD